MKQIPISQPSQEKIAAVARQLWEKDGRQDGRDLEYWLKAEKQLSSAKQQVNAPTVNLAAQSNAGTGRARAAARR
jgi:hypothetical protein